MKSSTYSAKNVSGVLDGQRVLGLWDGDDSITVEPLDDAGGMMVGADGSSIFSGYANEGATITLRLQHTSPTHRLLSQKLTQQRTPGMAITPFPFTLNDVDSGEGGTADETFIQTPPTDSKGKNAVVREWVLVTGYWKPNIPTA